MNLSARQHQVIHLLAEGFTRQEIAEFLHVSHHTIDKYMVQIREKTGAKNSAHVVAIGYERGLLP